MGGSSAWAESAHCSIDRKVGYLGLLIGADWESIGGVAAEEPLAEPLYSCYIDIVIQILDRFRVVYT